MSIDQYPPGVEAPPSNSKHLGEPAEVQVASKLIRSQHDLDPHYEEVYAKDNYINGLGIAWGVESSRFIIAKAALYKSGMRASLSGAHQDGLSVADTAIRVAAGVMHELEEQGWEPHRVTHLYPALRSMASLALADKLGRTTPRIMKRRKTSDQL